MINFICIRYNRVMNKIIIEQIKELLNEEDALAALCNSVAALYEEIDDINWLGFYFLKNNELVLGPFQGRIACTHLKLNKGVCAKAATTAKTVIVKDVHEFEGHIACDSRTNSEIVVPLIVDNQVIGVLDIDSLSFNRFDNNDQEILEEISKIISIRIQKAIIR